MLQGCPAIRRRFSVQLLKDIRHERPHPVYPLPFLREYLDSRQVATTGDTMLFRAFMSTLWPASRKKAEKHGKNDYFGLSFCFVANIGTNRTNKVMRTDESEGRSEADKTPPVLIFDN